MKKSERLLNISFGLSLIYWGIAGLFSNYEGLETSIIRWFVTLLNLTVGLLIIFRKPASKTSPLNAILISLPSLICGGLLFKLAKPLEFWNIYSEIIFILGGMFTLIAFLFLGRNFSILPEIRTVVSNGLFKIIRHPAYLGESIMVFACLFAAETYYSLLVFAVFVPCLMLRIKEEEKLLSTNIHYKAYTKEVKWKLIPYIW